MITDADFSGKKDKTVNILDKVLEVDTYRTAYKNAPKYINRTMRAAGYKKLPFGDITIFRSSEQGTLLVETKPDIDPAINFDSRGGSERSTDSYLLGYDIKVAFIDVPKTQRSNLENILKELEKL